MYFEELGKGNKQTILFIHGAMWPRSFCKQETLKKKYHCIFFHMNGHGKEYREKFERQKIILEIVDYIMVNKIKKPFVVGFSLGTQIAMSLANEYSNLIGKVALISPLFDASDEDIEKIKFVMVALGSLMKFTPLIKIAAKVIKIEEDCKKDFVEEMQRQKVKSLADEIMNERLLSKDLQNFKYIDNDVYIAVGTKDSECFINTAKQLKSMLKNSVLSTFECGHNIPIIESKKLNSELKMFFKE